jgi:alanine-glyoxylate transaminase/serine-glyoxylate transaminase/serine-pyruvate transaminase
MHKTCLLMIPGPTELTQGVLTALSAPMCSHLDPGFTDDWKQTLQRLRLVFGCSNGQPFVASGNGTLAMDMAAANLPEPDDTVLVVNTGVFGDRFASILGCYGRTVTQVCAPQIGDVPSLEAVENLLRDGNFKLLVATHVDTSTGVRVDVKRLAALGHRYGTLVVVDGVCAVAGEEMQQEEWNIDLVVAASQKALGAPPGLAIVMAGPRAVHAFHARKTPVRHGDADWTFWLPLVENGITRETRHRGTPPINLIRALNVALSQILAEGLEARVAHHELVSKAIKAGVNALGLTQVPIGPDRAAHTLSAVYYPPGLDCSLLAHVEEEGVILSGGFHPVIHDRYFRIGHMGTISHSDALKTLGALERGLDRAGYKFEPGAGSVAAQKVLSES